MGEKVGRKNVTQRLDELRGDQVWHRIAADAEALGFDARIRTQIGRLVIKRLLNPTQAQAGELIGRIYGRWERLHQVRRHCRSPYYGDATTPNQEDVERVIKGTVALDPLNDPDWIAQTESDYEAIQRAMPSRRTSEARDAIETLCVEDRAITGHQINLIYPVLNEVSVDFGLGPEALVVSTPFARTRSKPRTPQSVNGRPPKRTRQERVDRGEFAARTDDAKPLPGARDPQSPHYHPDAERDHAGLVRRLEEAQARRERDLPLPAGAR